MIFQDTLLPILESLPYGLGSFTRYNKRGWGYYDKYKIHQQYGKIFAHVTPAEIEVYIAEPSVSEQVLVTRKKEFVKPTEMVRKYSSRWARYL